MGNFGRMWASDNGPRRFLEEWLSPADANGLMGIAAWNRGAVLTNAFGIAGEESECLLTG